MRAFLVTLAALEMVSAVRWNPIDREYTYPEQVVPPRAPMYSIDYNDDYYSAPAKSAHPFYPKSSDLESYRPPLYPSYSYEEPNSIDPEDERAAREAALPIGREVWFEGEEPKFPRPNNVDSVFLRNLVLSEMARDANKKAMQLQQQQRETRDEENEDVRELKALAGKPLYHVAKTKPRTDFAKSLPTNNYAEEPLGYNDYPADDTFINWNSKRSVTAVSEGVKSSTVSTTTPATGRELGQKEVVMPGPATPVRHPFSEPVMNLLAKEKARELPVNGHADKMENSDEDRIMKRYIQNDADLVSELRGLKRRITT